MQKSWFFLSTLAEDIISPVFFNHHQIITIHDGLFFAAVNRSLHGKGNNKGFIHIFLDFICEAFAQYLFIDAQILCWEVFCFALCGCLCGAIRRSSFFRSSFFAGNFFCFISIAFCGCQLYGNSSNYQMLAISAAT